MRFLLKATPASKAVASVARTGSKALPKNNARNSTEHESSNITGKAFGQQCSPDCGCVLRFELQLSNNHSSPALSTTETIVAANYHAKRVMVTRSATNDDDSKSLSPSQPSTTLRPLLTSEHSSNASPILTSCTCNTLHELAQQVVDHLPGRTLQQLRNDTDFGVVGTRSSMAFRHTVLRENVLPVLSEREGRSWKKFGEMSSKKQKQQKSENNRSGSGMDEMDSTQRYGHCFDLVEDSFLSMIHERAIAPRKDDSLHAFSPTMGGYFRMYSPAGRQQKSERVSSQTSQDEDDIALGYAQNDSLVSQSGNWLRTSPSSYFLFGDENSNSKSGCSDGMLSLFIDYAKERIFGSDRNANVTAPAGMDDNYLQLMDMYGDNHSDDGEREVEPYDNWLDYVDANSQGR